MRTSAYEADYEAAAALKSLADRHSVAIVAAHHSRKATADDFLETVSGTHGLAGAADSVIVMKRARNSADAVLHITGRDVEDAECALTFDRGTWTLLEGRASDYELSDTRGRILDLLRADEGLTPKAIAEELKLPEPTVRQTLRRMVDDAQLDTDGSGRYFPPALSLVSPVSLTCDSSDGSDNP